MQAVASQVETDEIRLGQPAVVSFDAFPDLRLKARVSTLGAIATAGPIANNFRRSVPVYLSLLDHDNRVIPDLSTAANVTISQSAPGLLAPIEAVETKDGKSFVRVKTVDGFETRQVKTGASDNIHIALLQGVSAGDELLIDPALTLASN
jgi:cobalt-zinc-cadmium efflux system membrane fusion protein